MIVMEIAEVSSGNILMDTRGERVAAEATIPEFSHPPSSPAWTYPLRRPVT